MSRNNRPAGVSRSENRESAKQWRKGISSRDGLDMNALFDRSAEKTKDWVRENYTGKNQGAFVQHAAVRGNLGLLFAKEALGLIVDLEARLAAVESQKNMDAEVFEEVAKCLEKLDAMQSELGERSVRFRGYWRDGMDAIKGDMFSDRGSTYTAVRATRDRPDSHSPDWCLTARGAKDPNGN